MTASTVHPVIFQRDAKQVKRSLKTTDPELAKRRQEIHRQKVERRTSDSAKNLLLAEYDTKTQELIGGLAKRRMEIAGGTMGVSSRDRMRDVACRINSMRTRSGAPCPARLVLKVWRNAWKPACRPDRPGLRDTGPRVPTSISQRRERSGDDTIQRFPVLQIAQGQFSNLGDSRNHQASASCCKLESSFADNWFTDIGFAGHLIPFDPARPITSRRSVVSSTTRMMSPHCPGDSTDATR